MPTKVFIVVGAGGVGKTTVASLLGIQAAIEKKRTLIITVDPARRLLNALGINAVSSKEPVPVVLTKYPEAKLFAYMPDLKAEWRDFLSVSIDIPSIRQGIMASHLYQYLVDGLPGAFEIICSHLLFRLKNSGLYDVIVLDTPPSSEGLTFFDVPRKINTVLEEAPFKAIISARSHFLAKFAKKMTIFSSNMIKNTVEKLIGTHFLSELIDFLISLELLYEPLHQRTKAMQSLFIDPNTSFSLVCRPTNNSIADCQNLAQALLVRGIQINEIIVNQVIEPLKYENLLTQARQKLALIDFIKYHQNKKQHEEALITKLRKIFMAQSFKVLFYHLPKPNQDLMDLLLLDLMNEGQT